MKDDRAPMRYRTKLLTAKQVGIAVNPKNGWIAERTPEIAAHHRMARVSLQAAQGTQS